MAHSMDLNNIISCVVGISIFGFKKYWQTVFNLNELKMSPTFKLFLKAKKVNTGNKIILSMIRFKNNERFPQAGNDETENIQKKIVRQSGKDYRPGMHL